MKKSVFTSRVFALLLMVFCSPVMAFSSFTVRDIQVEGLQRITKGTVFNYMSVTPGSRLTTRRAQRVVRDLFKTELFSDVTLARRGSDVLVVSVVERPIILDFDLKGNEKLGGDELKKSLAEVGLAKNRQFKPSLLATVENQIRRQYYSNGFYGVRIRTDLKEETGNRVSIKINVHEGSVANIRGINIVGNKAYTEEALLDLFTLTTPGFDTVFNTNEQYSQEKLRGDLEKLTSFYQDQGYIKFEIESANVSLSPDREGTFITIRIDEGVQYKVKDFALIGEMPIDKKVLRQYVAIRKGDIFSRGIARRSAKAMGDVLATFGYAFAKVDAAPEIDDVSKTISLTFLVEPGKKVYVRRVNIVGNARTNDETIRREMRFLEGGPFASSALERSRARIARLPYVSNVKVDTEKVPGSEDLVDVKVAITERAPGSFQFGVGFSGSQGLLLNTSINHTNFLGTGSRLGLELSRSEISQNYSLSFSDPYFTTDGVGQSFNLYFRESDALSTNINSGFATDALGANMSFSWPVTEHQRLRFGFGAEELAMKTFASSSDEVLNFVLNNGSRFTTYSVLGGWSYDDRNRSLFPTAGSRHRVNVEMATPLGDLEYLTARYQGEWNFDLFADMSLSIDYNFGFAEEQGDTSEVPVFERYLAGGPNSVRGFDSASLGPKDSNDNPYGGTVRTVAQTELALPLGMKSHNRTTRLVLFYDVGNVYDGVDNFEASELRQSAGVGFYWMTPFLGIMRFSYGFPLNAKDGDEEDRFQFSFGAGF